MLKMNTFRKTHIQNFFKGFEKAPKQPIDAYLNHYLRKNKAIGSNDRKAITEAVYTLIRNLGFIDAHLSPSPSWQARLQFFFSGDLATLIERSELPLYQKLSFPKDLFEHLVASFGEKKTVDFCLSSNKQAPIMIRVNALKTTRDTLLSRWKDVYDISPCPKSIDGIIFHKKINFFTLSEFKEGLFEVQDEASQLIGGLVKAKPGDEVLDYCAGAGGKSLCIAPLMKNRGQIYLHDIRYSALLSAKKRLRRAGIQNAQIIFEDQKKMNRIKKRMDWVLVDAPCSGSGTWRRNPDQKWKFSLSMLRAVAEDQRKIFNEATTYVKPGGKIVYATCSVLLEENEKQIEYFCTTHNLTLAEPPFSSFPHDGQMDGFFGATLIKI